MPPLVKSESIMVNLSIGYSLEEYLLPWVLLSQSGETSPDDLDLAIEDRQEWPEDERNFDYATFKEVLSMDPISKLFSSLQVAFVTVIVPP